MMQEALAARFSPVVQLLASNVGSDSQLLPLPCNCCRACSPVPPPAPAPSPAPAGNEHKRKDGNLCNCLCCPQGSVTRALSPHRGSHASGGALVGQVARRSSRQRQQQRRQRERVRAQGGGCRQCALPRLNQQLASSVKPRQCAWLSSGIFQIKHVDSPPYPAGAVCLTLSDSQQLCMRRHSARRPPFLNFVLGGRIRYIPPTL
jgi:hypothetical protein